MKAAVDVLSDDPSHELLSEQNTVETMEHDAFGRKVQTSPLLSVIYPYIVEKGQNYHV